MEIKNLEGEVIFTYEGTSLEGANLQGVDLQWANLIGANLEGADLIGANLEWADLIGANLEGADLEGANLEGANLEGANLEGADLRGAKNIPEGYTNICLNQIYLIAKSQINEVPFLVEKIERGEIDGTQYSGDCCCFVGTLSKGKNESTDIYCSAIPFYEKGLHNPAEQWFYQIREGDTPENSFFAKKAVECLELALR